MMAVIYWWGASAFMIDKSVMDLTPAAAVATSIGVTLLGWFVYDGICRVPLRSARPAVAKVSDTSEDVNAHGIVTRVQRSE
jgi:uncharacterized membrane protein